MAGARADPAPRRSAARASAARPAPQPAQRAPARPVAVAAAPAPVPTTRDRLRASFGGGEPGPAAALAPVPAPAGETGTAPNSVAALAPVARPGPATSTRQRIENRARAPMPAREAPVRDAPLAPVIDIAVVREQRRAREAPQPAAVPAPVRAPAREPASPGAPRGPPAPEPRASEPAAPAAPDAATTTKPTGTAEAADPSGAIAPAAAAPQPAGSAPAAARASAPAPGAPGVAPTAAAPATAAPGLATTAPSPASASPQAASPPAPEAAAERRDPADEPDIKAFTARARAVGATAAAHQPAAEGAAGAQAAAEPPANELAGQAAANQVAVMGEQEPGAFDERAFIAAVRSAIEAATPATLEDADEFKESGAVGQATAAIGGLVAGGKAGAAGAIAQATDAPPSMDGTVPKPVVERVDDEAGPPLPSVGAAAAMPGPRPEQQTDLSSGPASVDATMAAANVTDTQLVNANEPDFSAALGARDAAREHAQTAPGEYRVQEEALLADARAGASGAAANRLEAMHGGREGALGGARGHKDEAQAADEAKRAQVATDVEAIYERTRTAVEEILTGLDTKVDQEFGAGEAAARTAFEDYVERRMNAYKDDRYSGLGGGALWLKDAAFGMPDEVNEFYVQGRADYLSAMDSLIARIAGIVGAALTAAKARIVAGRAEVRTLVEALPENLRKVGEEAESKLDARFEALSADVDAKQSQLVDAVARRYVESRDALDTRISELQAANQGFVDAALGFIGGVINTIASLKDMLLSVLAKAAAVIGDIIADPIGFLGNLVDGVMSGLQRFVARIGTHLENAFMNWLFGTLSAAGITLPERLDLPGILDLVLQVLGLTYQNIRARVALVVGEPVVAEMERAVDIFKTLATKGLAGVWEWIAERLADLEDMVLGKIKDWIVERVIKGGIAWIIGLLNPVAAFIKACKAIYEIVMFIVERGKQIMEFVNSVLDSIAAIAKGDTAAAADKVESSLAQALPLAISFLASLLNLGGLSEKIKEIVAAVRKPVERAIDAVVMGIAKGFKRTFGGVVGAVKGKVAAGKEWAEGKVAAGKAWVAGKAEAGGKYLKDKAAAGGKYLKGKLAGVKDDEEATAADVPQQGLEPEPPVGSLVIDEDVSDEEEKHELLSATGDDDLLVASGVPTPLTSIKDPTGKIATLHADYIAARSAYDTALANRRASPGKRSNWTVRLREVKEKVAEIVAHVRSLGLASAPGSSAPGIGESRPHGHKPPSLRGAIRIWWLESEHVIPFAVGKQLWDAVDETIPKRGRRADRMQTTIMLYERAAEAKTVDHDKTAIKTFKTSYLDKLAPELKAHYRFAVNEGSWDQESPSKRAYRAALQEVIEGIRDVQDSAVDATNTAIAAEHAKKNKGGVTNGQRRGEAEPLPTPDRVASVAADQMIDVINLALEAVEAAKREAHAGKRP